MMRNEVNERLKYTRKYTLNMCHLGRNGGKSTREGGEKCEEEEEERKRSFSPSAPFAPAVASGSSAPSSPHQLGSQQIPLTLLGFRRRNMPALNPTDTTNPPYNSLSRSSRSSHVIVGGISVPLLGAPLLTGQKSPVHYLLAQRPDRDCRYHSRHPWSRIHAYSHCRHHSPHLHSP